MTSGENDILENIAEVLTTKFRKELIISLMPYREKIKDGEKYQKIIINLLESLPEYVDLREKYNNLLEENKTLKGDNIILDMTIKDQVKNDAYTVIDNLCNADTNCNDTNNNDTNNNYIIDSNTNNTNVNESKTVYYSEKFVDNKFDKVEIKISSKDISFFSLSLNDK